MERYVDILVFAIAGFSFPLVNVFVISKLLRRDYPRPEKLSTYESGMTPIGDARVRFNLQYFVFALLFVVFEVEAAFLFPWAVVFQDIDRLFAFWEIIVFIVILAVGLVYAWKQRVLNWL